MRPTLLIIPAVLTVTAAVFADEATPGYPERVLQWTVQEGETCGDIAASLYGSPQHASLLERYNPIRCAGNKALTTGTTLVVPEKVTNPPTARLLSLKPDVRARPPAGGWSPAAQGMPLERRSSVNTMEDARADIRFVDRTRVFLAENTLVVIFGTAGQTAVSKTPPAQVQLDSGEIQAGLAALRGRPIEVDVDGGGRVSANSRDTVLKKKQTRTTVSVFDGSASVKSAGASVNVPARMGTSFVRAKPPTPPRPLPPAPSWGDPTNEGVVLAPAGLGTIMASWNAIPKASVYRLEVARDAYFVNLVVREEVPGDILSFRAEKMPPGTYYVRVRAIDDEDFLGLAASPKQVVLLGATLSDAAGGTIEAARIVAHPYGVLGLNPDPGLEMSLDSGPFGPIVPTIDLQRQTPSSIRVRARGSDDVHVLRVEYATVGATVSSTLGVGSLTATVKLTGFEGVDVASRVGPKLRVNLQGRSFELPLIASDRENNTFSAQVPLPDDASGSARLDVVDQRRRVLGSAVATLDQPAVPLAPGKRPPPPGVTAPPIPLSEATSTTWLGPGAVSAGYAGASIAVRDGIAVAQLLAAASGRSGPLGFDARVASNPLGDDVGADGSAWLGARWMLQDPIGGGLGIEPGLRVGVPMASSGPETRLEPNVALGALAGRWTWVVDVGLRQAIENDSRRSPTPDSHGFLLAGGTYEPLRWLRAFSVLDGHVMDADGLRGRGGMAVGAEAGTVLFGNLAVHASPWDDAGGLVSTHFAVGIREF